MESNWQHGDVASWRNATLVTSSNIQVTTKLGNKQFVISSLCKTKSGFRCTQLDRYG
jgi:hypothetical protein